MANKIGSKSWNNEMYEKHPTPYSGIAGFIQQKRLQKIAAAMAKYPAASGNTIAEIGCEEGNLLKFLGEQHPNYHCIGLDISSKALAEAKNHLPTSTLLAEHDITSGPYPFQKAPAYLICSETLEHIPNAAAAVENIYKSTGKDTIVIITVPIEKHKNNIKKWLVRLGVFNLFFKGIEASLSEWHVQDFSKADILGLLGKYYEILSYDTIWLMHQIIVVKIKAKTI